MDPEVEDLLYGPEWDYYFNKETEMVVFSTDSVLKSGIITVRLQLEFKYDDVVFYILEIQGLYDINQSVLSSVEAKDTDNNKQQESKFYMTIEKQQRDNLDIFETSLGEILEENLKDKYTNNFSVEMLEINERQIAEINYQNLDMNRSKTMYVSVSKEGISTITKKEVDMRRPHTSINIDKLDVNGSFYSNNDIAEIIKACTEKINVN